MAAKVFESIGKLGLGLAVAGGVVNSALYNGECEKLSASSSLYIFLFFFFCQYLGCSVLLLLMVSGENGHKAPLGCFIPRASHKREECTALSLESCRVAAVLVSRLGGQESRLHLLFAWLLPTFSLISPVSCSKRL